MKPKEKMLYALYIALLYPLALLPLPVLYIISDALYFLIYKCFKYRIKVVRQNLKNSFPEMTDVELRTTEKEFYHSLCDIIVETIKQLHISDRELRRRVEVVNYHLVDEITAKDKPVVLYLAHYCNWEWALCITLWYSKASKSGHIYKAMKDKAADKIMKKARGHFDSRGIEITNAVREILHLLSEDPHYIIGFISDHRFNSVPRHQSTLFLNQDTPYYVGGEAIGRKVGAEFLYLDVEKLSRGHYRLTFMPMQPDPSDTEPYPITRMFYRMLEKTIRRQPGLWLWSHRRWI